MSEKIWDNICLQRWDDLYTSESGRGHAEHLCPLPYGHREDHTCICELSKPLKEEYERLKTLVEAYRTHWRRAYVGRPPFDTEMKPW